MEMGFVAAFPTLNGGAMRSQGSPTLERPLRQSPTVNGGAARSEGSPSLSVDPMNVSAVAMSNGVAR